MNEKRIEEIVRKVYRKAKEACASAAKNALTKHVEEAVFEEYRMNISYKTVERAFDKYIDGKKIGSPLAESVDLFCKYLGFEGYQNYISNRKRKRILTISITIAFGAVLTMLSILRNELPVGFNHKSISTNANECITWADSLYVTVPCDTGPLSSFGTKIESEKVVAFRNMRKIMVNASYQFFNENGEPLIWYYKNEEGEIEYFTAPGLHPANGETLKKITPYIIEKYVPLYSD